MARKRREISEKETVVLSFHIDKITDEWIEMYATDHGITKRETVQMAVHEFLKLNGVADPTKRWVLPWHKKEQS